MLVSIGEEDKRTGIDLGKFTSIRPKAGESASAGKQRGAFQAYHFRVLQQPEPRRTPASLLFAGSISKQRSSAAVLPFSYKVTTPYLL